MWGHSTLFSSSIISGSPNWLTKFHYFISIHHCFHSKENGHCTILHYICSYKFFGALTDPTLLHILTHQGIFLILLSYFQLPYCFLMGIRFSNSCVFIFYIVFSFSLQTLFVADFCNMWKLFDRNIYILNLYVLLQH